MRASRLVSTLLLLQSRGRLTAQQLADTLEVSVRTVYRDMEALAAAGIPVYGEAGKEGGYQLVEGYSTRLTGLTTAEAQTVFLTGLPSAAADLGLGPAFAGARLKLTAALPADQREHANRMQRRFLLDTPSWYGDLEDEPHLPAVAEAVLHQRPLRMRYFRWAEPQVVGRTVAPYGVVLKAGHWYLVARHSRCVRTYRVSRILDLQTLPDSFDWPVGFDLEDYWRGYLATFDSRRHRAVAVLRLSPPGFARLPQLMETAVAVAARRSATEPDGDGWRQVTVPIESVEQILPELLKLGAEAEVLAPVELRDRVGEILTAMLDLYRR
jgi:predicted DNA-binding transcriptional regulator YafY